MSQNIKTILLVAAGLIAGILIYKFIFDEDPDIIAIEKRFEQKRDSLDAVIQDREANITTIKAELGELQKNEMRLEEDLNKSKIALNRVRNQKRRTIHELTNDVLLDQLNDAVERRLPEITSATETGLPR